MLCRYPWISYSDLWTLAGATAIEAMGGVHTCRGALPAGLPARLPVAPAFLAAET